MSHRERSSAFSSPGLEPSSLREAARRLERLVEEFEVGQPLGTAAPARWGASGCPVGSVTSDEMAALFDRLEDECSHFGAPDPSGPASASDDEAFEELDVLGGASDDEGFEALDALVVASNDDAFERLDALGGVSDEASSDPGGTAVLGSRISRSGPATAAPSTRETNDLFEDWTEISASTVDDGQRDPWTEDLGMLLDEELLRDIVLAEQAAESGEHGAPPSPMAEASPTEPQATTAEVSPEERSAPTAAEPPPRDLPQWAVLEARLSALERSLLPTREAGAIDPEPERRPGASVASPEPVTEKPAALPATNGTFDNGWIDEGDRSGQKAVPAEQPRTTEIDPPSFLIEPPILLGDGEWHSHRATSGTRKLLEALGLRSTRR